MRSSALGGIPFAEAPLGPLRWAAPRPPTPWAGIRDAVTLPPACPQHGPYPRDAPPESTREDCLYLNIWRPLAVEEEPLPVMLWIHGGGLTHGSGSVPLYATFGDAILDRLVPHAHTFSLKGASMRRKTPGKE